jgi:hypothetical protein
VGAVHSIKVRPQIANDRRPFVLQPQTFLGGATAFVPKADVKGFQNPNSFDLAEAYQLSPPLAESLIFAKFTR